MRVSRAKRFHPSRGGGYGHDANPRAGRSSDRPAKAFWKEANSATGQFGFGYDALSRRTSLTRPNGVSTAYSYDNLSHLLSVLHQAGTNTIDGASYTYDNAGNRTSKLNYLDNVTENYTYDPLYQLTQVTQGPTTTESYSYDPVGNRLSALGMLPYTYNSSNQLLSTPQATYTYDANGNTTSKTDANGTTAYTWDFENQLTSAVVPGTGTVSFRYDPFGKRIQKSGSNGTISYLYDGSNSIAELDQSGNLLARYVQGAGIDEPLSALRSGTAGFYEADGLGSITSLSTLTGTISDSYTYDAFGNATASGSFVNPYHYTARDYDSETGLQYSRARYYDPKTGRFISEDPIGLAVGDNYYAYVGNDPTDLIDPAGLSPDWWDWLMAKLGLGPSGASGTSKSCPLKCDPDGYRKVTPEEGKALLQEALKHRGAPYGGKGPKGFDCSGLVCYSIQHSLNAQFPDIAVQTGGFAQPQVGLAKLGANDSHQAGDIELFGGHVGLYDPNPPASLPGQTLLSARGSPNNPPEKNKGVTWGRPDWFGTPTFYRLRIPCSR